MRQGRHRVLAGRQPALRAAGPRWGYGRAGLAALVLALLPPAGARGDVYDKLAKRLVDGVDGLAQGKVAVLPFAFADGRSSPGGRIVAEALSTAIAERDAGALVERTQVDAAMKEISLSFTGAISSGTALEAGRLAGARFLVLGTLSDDGDSKVLVNARLIETESAVVRSAGKVSVKKTWRDLPALDATGPAPLKVSSARVPSGAGAELLVLQLGERRVLVEYMISTARPHVRLTDVTDPKDPDTDEVDLPYDAPNNRFRALGRERVKLHGRRYLLWSGVWKPETGPVLHLAPLKGFWRDDIVESQEVLFDFLDLLARWTKQVEAKGHFLGERDGLNLVAFFERLPKTRLRVSVWRLDAENNLARTPSAHFVIEGRRGQEAASSIRDVGTRHFRFRYDVDGDKVTVEEL